MHAEPENALLWGQREVNFENATVCFGTETISLTAKRELLLLNKLNDNRGQYRHI